MKNLHRTGLGLLLLWALAAGSVLAQTTTVSGTVSDVNGETLPGVSVLVQGTTIGTTTNLEGRYELQLPPGRRTLVFSFVGFQTEEVELAAGQSTLDLVLEEDILGLDEVVVTGLATSVKRSNLANSVATISARELADVTTSQTFDGALSGKVPGALISAYSGAPGGGISVKLRGISTINGASQPLYILDGVILDNSAVQSGVDAVSNAAGGGSGSRQDNPVNRIADLNPEDIESIEILKGASAAALYGARASNGVVIIQTKRGSAGRTNVSFSQNLGVTQILNPLGVRQYTAETAETFFGARGRQEFEAAQGGRGFVDYEDQIYGNDGLLLTSSLSISGGNDQTRFFVSGLIKDDEGIVQNTGHEKQSVRANVSHRLSQRSELSVTTNYVRAETERGLTGNDNSGTTFGISLAATPNFIELRPDAAGVYPDHPFNTANPLQTRDLMTNKETVNRFIGSGQFRYNLLQRSTQALQFILEGGVDTYGLENVGYFPNELQFERLDVDGRGTGTSILREGNTLNTNWRSLLVHTLSVPSNNISFTTQGGLTGANFDQNLLLLIADGLVPGQRNVDQAASLGRSQTRSFQKDRSFFVQEEINVNDQIVLTAGLRGDKSTINGDVNKFNLFPKASVALNLSNFGFWTFNGIDQFKLRGAFGQTGNIAGFGIKYTTFASSAIGGNVGGVIGTQRGFADVEPERQTELEGGLDVSVLDGRANLEFTVYRKQIDDMLLQREVEPSTGFSTETFNGGQLVNRGLEVSLSILPVNQPNFRWFARTNFWTNDAEVTELPVPPFRALGGGFGATLGEVRIEEGKSPTQIAGIDDQLVQRFDDDGNLIETLGPGSDGRADGTYALGDVAPDFQMTFLNDVTLFRNVSLSVLAHWKQGGQNLNLTELLTDLFGTSPDYDETTTFTRFVPDADVADLQASVGDALISANCTGSEYAGFQRCEIQDQAGDARVNLLGVSAAQFVQNSSYFRIREIGLYYTFQRAQLERLFGGNVRSVKLGVSAKNPLLISPYKSYDPEVNNFATVPVSDGVEVTPYPSSRQWMFHFSVRL